MSSELSYKRQLILAAVQGLASREVCDPKQIAKDAIEIADEVMSEITMAKRQNRDSSN